MKEKMPFPMNPEKKRVPENQQNVEREKPKKEVDETRRNLLKLIGGTLGLISASAILRNSRLIENLRQIRRSEAAEIPEKDQEEIEEQETMAQKIDYDAEGRIEINPETAKATENFWEEQYKNNPVFSEGFEYAYQKMQYKIPRLKAIFREEEVPEKFAYLAIPESNWGYKKINGEMVKIREENKKGAAGPYQITRQTAKDYGLNSDERHDPLKSARACAQILKDLYDKTRDWNLALAGYNGSFVWEYIKTCGQKSENPSYEGFLKSLENKINNFRDNLRAMNYLTYEIKKGDTLSEVAQIYGLNLAELLQANGFDKHSVLKIGQKIKCPIKDKKGIFDAYVEGLMENLNYPPKFNAVMNIIKKREQTTLAQK